MTDIGKHCPYCREEHKSVELREWGKHTDGHTIYKCPRCQRLTGGAER